MKNAELERSLRMEEDNIKIDEEELYKQLVEEISNQEHSLIVTIAVPNLSLQSFLGDSKMISSGPVVNVTDGGGGTNAMTRAMAAITLQETADSLLEEDRVNDAYKLLKFMTKQEKYGGKKNGKDS